MIKLYKGKFDLGKLYLTRGVNDRVADNTAYAKFVTRSIQRHFSGDWGELGEEDKQLNDLSLDSEDPGRIFSAYEFKGKEDRIWIITEWNREYTTVLFPSEY